MKGDNTLKAKPILIANDIGFDNKTAIITFASNADTCRLTPGGQWLNAVRQWTPGQTVVEVNHFGRHTTVAGDILALETIKGKIMAHVEVMGITMVNGEDLTTEQIADLGYTSRQAYEDDWGKALAGKAWYMSIHKLTPRQQYNGKVH